MSLLAFNVNGFGYTGLALIIEDSDLSHQLIIQRHHFVLGGGKNLERDIAKSCCSDPERE
jgi:hypothetical protein